MMKIGYNMSTIINKESLKKAEKDGCNFIQIFTGDPCKFTYNRNQMSSDLINLHLKNWKGGIVIHGNFLINLCRPSTDKIAKNSIYLLHLLTFKMPIFLLFIIIVIITFSH